MVDEGSWLTAIWSLQEIKNLEDTLLHDLAASKVGRWDILGWATPKWDWYHYHLIKIYLLNMVIFRSDFSLG